MNRFLGNRLKKDLFSDLSDIDLVNSALNGSREGWRELVRRHYRMISSTVYRITGGREFEDVIQEVLIQLFKSLGSFRGESSFSTFLYRLTLNTACREVKKMTNLSSMIALGGEVVEKILENNDISESVVEELEKKEMEELIRKAMYKISPDLRMYLILFYVEELKLKEIAQMVGSPVTTVASRINKGKVLLLKEMEKLQ